MLNLLTKILDHIFDNTYNDKTNQDICSSIHSFDDSKSKNMKIIFGHSIDSYNCELLFINDSFFCSGLGLA